MRSPVVFRLTDALWFPPLTDRRYGEKRHDGLVAVGGDLSVERLLLAYRSGIFPWPHHHLPQNEEHLLWFSPDPRFVILPHELHVPKSLNKRMKHNPFRVTVDQAFEQVIEACASIKRKDEVKHGEHSTWINSMIKQSYTILHKQGWAHSVEVWEGDELVGGFYGVAMGAAFFGESMFSKVPDASKVGFATFAHNASVAGYRLIDCQVYSEHMERFGAKPMVRRTYLHALEQATKENTQLLWSHVKAAMQ